MTGINVRRGGMEHLPGLVGLFDGYRTSYGQTSDRVAAEEFLRARLEAEESVIFVAFEEDAARGFTQLFPSYSSVAMQPVWILNDLFVVPEARRRGIARMLLQAAVDFGRARKACRLVLATAADNHPAQRLYEESGWERDPFLHYRISL